MKTIEDFSLGGIEIRLLDVGDVFTYAKDGYYYMKVCDRISEYGPNVVDAVILNDDGVHWRNLISTFNTNDVVHKVKFVELHVHDNDDWTKNESEE